MIQFEIWFVIVWWLVSVFLVWDCHKLRMERRDLIKQIKEQRE